MSDTVYWISAIGWYHLLMFGVAVPLLAYRSRQRLLAAPAPMTSRLRQYRATAVTLLLFATFSIVTAMRQDLDLLSGAIARPWQSAGAAIAFYAIAVTAMRPMWRRAILTRKPHVYFFIPSSPAERGWWIAVSVLAGISEEITWRGVQTPLLAGLIGSVWAGGLVCAVMFGAGHATQGLKSSSLIVLFALGFQGLVWLSDSLVPAMAVHVLYDVTAGLTYGRFARQMRSRDYFPEKSSPGF